MTPGRQATARWRSWHRVTGRWVTVTGQRREGDVLISVPDATPSGVTWSVLVSCRPRPAGTPAGTAGCPDSRGTARPFCARSGCLGSTLSSRQNSEFPTSAPMNKNTAQATVRRTVAGDCHAVNDVPGLVITARRAANRYVQRLRGTRPEFRAELAIRIRCPAACVRQRAGHTRRGSPAWFGQEQALSGGQVLEDRTVEARWTPGPAGRGYRQPVDRLARAARVRSARAEARRSS